MKMCIQFVLVAALLVIVGCGRPSDAPGDPAAAAHVEWLTNYDAAVRQAGEENKRVFINFTGSDWCPPCMRLKQDTFDRADFINYAGDHLVLLEIDFPQRKQLPPEQQQHNEELGAKFEIQAFPTLVLLNSDGQELRRTTGFQPGGPRSMIEWIGK